MKATLLLADAAQRDSQGKIHALGLGWSVIGNPSPPMALVVILDCAWNETNTKHKIEIDLLDADGKPVTGGQGPLGQPMPAVHVDGEIEVGRPPGFPVGSPLREQLVVPLGPGLPLEPGQKYEFRLSLNGRPIDSWASTFYVAPDR